MNKKNKVLKTESGYLFPADWTCDKKCTEKRRIATCVDCVRFQLGICPKAEKAYRGEMKENGK